MVAKTELKRFNWLGKYRLISIITFGLQFNYEIFMFTRFYSLESLLYFWHKFLNAIKLLELNEISTENVYGP